MSNEPTDTTAEEAKPKADAAPEQGLALAAKIIEAGDRERRGLMTQILIFRARAERAEDGLRQIEDIVTEAVGNPGMELNTVQLVQRMAEKVRRAEAS